MKQLIPTSKYLILTLMLMIQSSSFADSFGNDDTKTQGFIDAGLTFGGDTLLTSEFSDSSVKAGSGAYAAVGIIYNLNESPLSVFTSVGVHADGFGDETFSRIPIELGSFYEKNQYRIGLAFAKQTNVELQDEEFSVDFKDANTIMIIIGYKPDFLPGLWTHLRLAQTDYQVGSIDIDGNYVGFHILAYHNLF